MNIALASTSPPDPNKLSPPPTWHGFFVMFLFFGAVVAVSLISSKRGHQD